METIKTELRNGVTVGVIEFTLDGRYSAMRRILNAGIEFADAVVKDEGEDDDVREDFHVIREHLADALGPIE